MNEYPINKQIYRIMKYIYRKDFVTLQDIEDKFGNGTHTCALSLCYAQYALLRKSGHSGFETDLSNTSGSDKVTLSVQGQAYVWERRRSFIMWFVPTIVSIAAMMSSVASIIFSSRMHEVIVYLAE